eukprot:COSAG05_NODE_25315_length_198_cov_18.828283_1_plen_23_part_10
MSSSESVIVRLPEMVGRRETVTP